nr:hypothetical protein [Pandoravirus massiliensis]
MHATAFHGVRARDDDVGIVVSERTVAEHLLLHEATVVRGVRPHDLGLEIGSGRDQCAVRQGRDALSKLGHGHVAHPGGVVMADLNVRERCRARHRPVGAGRLEAVADMFCLGRGAVRLVAWSSGFSDRGSSLDNGRRRRRSECNHNLLQPGHELCHGGLLQARINGIFSWDRRCRR